jgi:hypothetical protein
MRRLVTKLWPECSVADHTLLAAQRHVWCNTYPWLHFLLIEQPVGSGVGDIYEGSCDGTKPGVGIYCRSWTVGNDLGRKGGPKLRIVCL